MPISQRPTRDELLPKFVTLPENCITAGSLRTLATALDRLQAFHRDHGGPAPEAPCLVEVHVEHGHVHARVTSDGRVFRLELVRGAWEFR